MPEQSLIDLLNESENGIYHKTYFDSWLNGRKKFAHTFGRRFNVLAADPDVKFLPEKNIFCSILSWTTKQAITRLKALSKDSMSLSTWKR